MITNSDLKIDEDYNEGHRGGHRILERGGGGVGGQGNCLFPLDEVWGVGKGGGGEGAPDPQDPPPPPPPGSAPSDTSRGEVISYFLV